MNSRNKGKTGELEWARFCRDRGYDCRRTAQYCGNTGDASDVIGLPGIHQEIKRVERLDLYAAIDQAARDATNADKGELPIVAHRKNHCKWLVTMLADDWFRLYIAFEIAMDKFSRRLKYAERARDDAIMEDRDCDLHYWRGYIDGIKAVQQDSIGGGNG